MHIHIYVYVYINTHINIYFRISGCAFGSDNMKVIDFLILTNFRSGLRKQVEA